MRAVDSEHGKNLNADAWRQMQLAKHTANRGHPYAKFFTGARACAGQTAGAPRGRAAADPMPTPTRTKATPTLPPAADCKPTKHQPRNNRKPHTTRQATLRR